MISTSSFLVVPASTWGVYSNDPCPTAPPRPGTNPQYLNTVPLKDQIIKDQWAVAKKYYEEDKNMNKSLTERFLSLLPTKYT